MSTTIPSRRVLAGFAMLVLVIPAAPALAGRSTTFKTRGWTVTTRDPSGPSKRSVKPNGTVTVCNTSTIGQLTLFYSFRNGSSGAVFQFVFTGPDGTQSADLRTGKGNGKSVLIFTAPINFPGNKSASTPISPGKYTIRFKRAKNVLLSSSITFLSTHSC